MMLLAFFIPVFLLSINYSVKRIQSSHKLGITSSAAFAVGAAALEKYNPAKTWTTQRERIYTAGAQALCDRAFDIDKKMFMTESSTQIYYINRGYGSYSLTKMYAVLSSYGLASNFNLQTGLGGQLTTKNSLLCDDAPLDSVVFNPSKGELSFKFYSTSGGTEARNVVKYAEDSGKLAMTLDVSKKCLKCDCKCIEKVVNAYPAQCDVDIILTLPVNHAACTSSNSNSATLVAPNGTASTPVKEIANGYVEFLKNHFLHTAGVAVGVVPYSGKISIPPNRSNWTAAIPPMNRLPDLPYLKQAAVYGSDGQLGGDIVAGEYLYDDWGNPEYGSPIMFRRGQTDSYRSVQLFRGYALLSTDNPMFNTAYLFQRMNLNPCYLGHCNLLAVMCEKNCPVYRANPYFITELTDDVQNVIYDLGLIRPVDDPKNKSNFLFLAVQWAYNLLSWGGHPSSGAQSGEKFAHPARNAKKRAIILVANAPDHFEPQELTYLGFNNDNSEIPMQESDKIDFSVDYSDASQKFLDGSPHDGRIAGLKKILEYV
ncbi:MAG: hypothetical protein LBO02_03035, partial [Holosporaceae bacterium]|nr:hypothetical protein [Holosporaceae bacterium]